MHKVYNKPRVEKLGIRSGQKVVLLDVDDATFADEVEALGAKVLRRRARDADLLFMGANQTQDLVRIADVMEDIKKDGALWVVRPKGVKAITEAQVMHAGLSAGLVDVKVVSFSATHTAEKFVYRLRDR
jgi:hypothetical protein